MSDDLDLNSIDRFRKSSSRLVLEEHSSCEVPAGCGGVILRWHNPNVGVPVVIHCAVAARVDIYVNGKPIASRAVLSWGQNTLAIRLHEFESESPFVLAMRRDNGSSQATEEGVLEGCTRDDGSWKYSAEQPDGWQTTDFDDADWRVLDERNSDFPDDDAYRYQNVQRIGGTPLRLPVSTDSICIRSTFFIERRES